MKMERKEKAVSQLDTRYTEAHWPTISSENQEVILGMLVSLLAPIGRHRAACRIPSKEKRRKKRKRLDVQKDDSSVRADGSEAPLPMPEISSHLLIGLASITRFLELVASTQNTAGTHKSSTSSAYSIKPRHLSAIFVCRSSQPSILHDHLPQLIATTSLRSPNPYQTRLVQLPPGSESRICFTLGLPHASFIGILEGAQHSGRLLQLVQDIVPIIEVLWLAEARKAQYRLVRINSILSTEPIGYPRIGTRPL